jgi:hypothetical protein
LKNVYKTTAAKPTTGSLTITKTFSSTEALDEQMLNGFGITVTDGTNTIAELRATWTLKDAAGNVTGKYRREWNRKFP